MSASDFDGSQANRPNVCCYGVIAERLSGFTLDALRLNGGGALEIVIKDEGHRRTAIYVWHPMLVLATLEFSSCLETPKSQTLT